MKHLLIALLAAATTAVVHGQAKGLILDARSDTVIAVAAKPSAVSSEAGLDYTEAQARGMIFLVEHWHACDNAENRKILDVRYTNESSQPALGFAVALCDCRPC